MSLSVSPRTAFWICLAITIATGIKDGSVHLAHMIPHAWETVVIAWSSFFVWVGMWAMTALHLVSSSEKGYFASNEKKD